MSAPAHLLCGRILSRSFSLSPLPPFRILRSLPIAVVLYLPPSPPPCGVGVRMNVCVEQDTFCFVAIQYRHRYFTSALIFFSFRGFAALTSFIIAFKIFAHRQQ